MVQNMKKSRIFFLLLSFLLLAGCGKKDEETTDTYKIYYVDKEETKVSREDAVLEKTDTEGTLQELFILLEKQPDDAEYRSAIPDTVTLESYSFADSRITLNFSPEYSNMTPNGEVLSRAAIVRTLCQVEGVTYVAFNVAGEGLLNNSGVPVGYMTKDQFVDNAGNEISAYEKASLTLYFADRDGSKLIPVTQEVVYNSNISMDKLVVEKLIEGPDGEESEENGYAVMPPSTEIISVTTRDGTCYVNLNDGFMTKQGNVTPDVAIYSIVNSLVELPSVNKVQISINGESELSYMETIPLSQIFERNLEIISNAH